MSRYEVGSKELRNAERVVAKAARIELEKRINAMLVESFRPFRVRIYTSRGIALARAVTGCPPPSHLDYAWTRRLVESAAKGLDVYVI